MHRLIREDEEWSVFEDFAAKHRTHLLSCEVAAGGETEVIAVLRDAIAKAEGR